MPLFYSLCSIVFNSESLCHLHVFSQTVIMCHNLVLNILSFSLLDPTFVVYTVYMFCVYILASFIAHTYLESFFIEV